MTTSLKKKREKTYYVCYSLPEDESTWKMLRIRAEDEDDAWELAKKKKIKREDANLVYVKCTS